MADRGWHRRNRAVGTTIAIGYRTTVAAGQFSPRPCQPQTAEPRSAFCAGKMHDSAFHCPTRCVRARRRPRRRVRIHHIGARGDGHRPQAGAASSRRRRSCRRSTSSRPSAGPTASRRPPPPAPPSPPSRAASTIRAGCTCCPTAMCSSPKPTPRPARTTTRASRAGSSSGIRRRPAAPSRAPTGSRCCAMPTATARPRFSTAFLTGLNSPFGMALVGDAFYVANTRRHRPAFHTRKATWPSTRHGVKVVALPAGERNHHWTKSLIASPDGSKLYVGIGSNSNVAEHGIDEEEGPRRDVGGRRQDRCAPRLRLGPAQSGRHGVGADHRRPVGGRQRARRTGQRPRARLHDRGARTAASTAGRTATTAGMSTSASSRRAPTSSPRRWCPTTRSARTPRRWVSRPRRATGCRRSSAAACSSASTARGTASRAAATR